MKILLEDKDQIAVYKPAGLATQTARLGEKDLVSEVKNYLSREKKIVNPYVAVINRLDQPVEGIVLFAKNERAAAMLTAQMQNSKMQKYYYAVVYGQMEAVKETLTDYLKKDNRSNLSSVVSKDLPMAKKAVLEYEVLATKGELQLVKIHLLTGRHHQIRVQFSHRGHPLIGDIKYGSKESIALGKEMNVRTPALCAYSLTWENLTDKSAVSVYTEPEHPVIRDLKGL